MSKKTKKYLFNKVLIIGIGLIGSSIALSLKKNGIAQNIVGFSKTEKTRKIAKKKGIVDETINRISNLLKMERTTLTRNLNVLKKAGWVKSNTGSDGRFTYINLTAKGNKVLSKVFPHWSKAQDQVKKILGGELDSFQKNLKNINTNLI